MKIVKYYVSEGQIIAGITLKSENRLEQNNMALHVCENKENVIQNRLDLAQELNYSLDQFVCAQQTHSANYYKVTKDDLGRGAKSQSTAIPNTDALYTKEPNIVLCTFTADCVPVYIYNERAGIVGVIHSGWKGTIQEITKKTLLHISKTESCYIEDFHIYLGMALSQKRFLVDEDVFRLFAELGYANSFITYNEATNKYHIDNQLVIKKQCELIGIPQEQIIIDRTCTYDSKTGFSYRENKQAGRHLGFIVRKNY